MKYRCLILDHDDTVVASEESVNYPCFLEVLDHYRPGEYMDPVEFAQWNFRMGYADFMRVRYHFTGEELAEEFQMWQDYAAKHIPPAYPGIREVILEHKRQGGILCVASHSGRQIISRDYLTHFGLEPDRIFSWDDPRDQRKPLPYPVLQTMEEFDLRPSDILVVDDLRAGYDMAKAAGVDFAYAGWGRKNVPEIGEFMKQFSKIRFSDPKELYKLQFDPLTAVL